MGSTKKILFVLAIVAGALVTLKFVWKPSPSLTFQPSNLPAVSPSVSPSVSPIVSSPKFSRVAIDNQELSVELATTSEEKSQGLSGRTGIGSDGMLFVMNPSQIAVFWMKDMKFAIDIVWIKEGEVIGFVENALPPAGGSGALDKQLPTYSSKTPIDYVLEVEAGYVKEHGIKVGTTFITLH